VFFDYAFSVGVLHHLPDPRAGFRSLAGKVKDGGHLSAWVTARKITNGLRAVSIRCGKNFSSRMNRPGLVASFKVADRPDVFGD